ncbi:MAG: hypothetical protein ABH827_01645 [bacterium]
MKKLSFFTLTLTLGLIFYNNTAFSMQSPDGYESDNEDIAKTVSKSKSKVATKYFTTKLTQIAGLTDQISTNLLFLDTIEKEEKDAAQSFSQNIKRSLKKDLTELAKKTTFVIDNLFELRLFKKFKAKNSEKIQQLKDDCANIQKNINDNAQISNQDLKKLLLLVTEVIDLTKEYFKPMSKEMKIALAALTITTVTLIAAGFYFGWWKATYTGIKNFEYKATASNTIASIKEKTNQAHQIAKNAIAYITTRLQALLKKLGLSGKAKTPIITEQVITEQITEQVITEQITEQVITEQKTEQVITEQGTEQGTEQVNPVTDPVSLNNYDVDGAITCANQCFKDMTIYTVQPCTISCIKNSII